MVESTKHEKRTLVIPRFSIAGMVYPMSQNSSERFKAAHAQRTSEVELPLFDGIELGGNGLDEFGREFHGGRARTCLSECKSESGGPRARVARNRSDA